MVCPLINAIPRPWASTQGLVHERQIMFRTTRRPFVTALAGISLVSLVSLSCHADDALTGAVSQFREKDHTDGFALALKTADSPQRTFLLGVSALRQG